MKLIIGLETESVLFLGEICQGACLGAVSEADACTLELYTAQWVSMIFHQKCRHISHFVSIWSLMTEPIFF